MECVPEEVDIRNTEVRVKVMGGDAERLEGLGFVDYIWSLAFF